MRVQLFFLPIFCFLGILRGNSQSYNGVDHYKTKTFNDAIFSKDIPLSIDTPLNRFTPTRGEVDTFEKKISKKKADTNNGRYFNDAKQYFGVINQNGHKILYVNCFSSVYYDTLLLNWLHEPVSIGALGIGGHWSAKFDLSSGKSFDYLDEKLIYSTPRPAIGVDHYKTKNFDDAIFSKNVGTLIDTSLKRFTPNRKEIDDVEAELQNQKFNTKGQKQYFGYIDSNGNRILVINGFQMGELAYFWLKIPIVLAGYDNLTWNVRYNLSKHLFVNYKMGSTEDCFNYKGVHHYKTNDFDVAIFPKTKNNEIDLWDSMCGEYAPTKEQVEFIERKLIKMKAKCSKNDTDNYFIATHSAKYGRQYFGYINKNKHKILFINCFCGGGFGVWDGPFGVINDMLSGEIDVQDGGSCYWKVCYDLDTDKFFDLRVNGSA
jgi:hypothetical protein